jgi:hypothetical protein
MSYFVQIVQTAISPHTQPCICKHDKGNANYPTSGIVNLIIVSHFLWTHFCKHMFKLLSAKHESVGTEDCIA